MIENAVFILPESRDIVVRLCSPLTSVINVTNFDKHIQPSTGTAAFI